MKFLHLKTALEKAFTKAPEPKRDIVPKPRPPFYSPQSLKAVVLTDKISRDPIDQTARLVTSKTPWWAKLEDYGTTIKRDKRENEMAKIGQGKPHHPRRKKIFTPTTNGAANSRGKKKKEVQICTPRSENPKMPTASISKEELFQMLLKGAITSDEYESFLDVEINPTI